MNVATLRSYFVFKILMNVHPTPGYVKLAHAKILKEATHAVVLKDLYCRKI